MLKTLAWLALLLAGSAAQDASRTGAPASPVLPQTQAAPQQKQTDAAAAGAFQITGRVVNSMTNAPVAGAYVVINAASASNLSCTVRAGTDGSFAFSQIPAGRYVLMARRKGYVEQTYLQHQQFTTAILVGPNLDSENLVFPLAPEGIISGEVTDEAGEVVQSARMLLFREDTRTAGTQSIFRGSKTRTMKGSIDSRLCRVATTISPCQRSHGMRSTPERIALGSEPRGLRERLESKIPASMWSTRLPTIPMRL